MSGLNPVTEPGQRFPAGVAWTLIAVARLGVPVLAAARAKSLAVRLAQGSDRQGQKHLLTQHIFKQKTVSLIIPDFRFRRSNGPFQRLRIGHCGPEDQVVFGLQRDFDRLHAACAGDLEFARKATLEPNVGHYILGAAVLVEHLSPPFGGQLPNLFGFLTQFYRSRSQFQIEIDRLPLQLAYLEFHVMSLRRTLPRVNPYPRCKIHSIYEPLNQDDADTAGES
jgi:hypothetical protein